MSITFPITMPTFGIEKITLKAVNIVAVSTSPFTGQQQVYEHQGGHWQADIQLAKMDRDTAEVWISSIISLRGQVGTLLIGDPAGTTPQGTVSGSPVVNGAGQSGFELSIRSLTGGFKAGDYIQIGNHLHKIVQDVSGATATLDIWPRLRESPGDGDPVIYTNAKGLFRLSSPISPFSYSSPTVSSVSFSITEAI